MSSRDRPERAADAPRQGPDGDDRTLRRAFESSIEVLMPDLLRYFARRVVPVADAADCLSETLVVLWKHRSRLPETAAEQRAWAFGIARNILANHHRKRRRRHNIDEQIRNSLPVHPVDVPAHAEAAAEALSLLPQKDQELIRLIIWDGFGVAEAGKLLGMKEPTARSRYARAKGRLRETLAADRLTGQKAKPVEPVSKLV